MNKTLNATISANHLNYLPCSMTEPNTDNRCANAEDANWAAPFLFGRWAWDGYLFGAKLSGPGVSLIDATYHYGFGRLAGKLPPNTFGGYPTQYYSTAYNAGYGEWGLASTHYRDQGILSYEFMIANGQSGPYSWWESQQFPNPGSPWAGTHPEAGNGSSPHAWGMANANMVLLDSLAAQRADGSLIVGRGVPGGWLQPAASRSAWPTCPPRTASTSGLTIRDQRHRGHADAVRDRFRPGRCCSSCPRSWATSRTPARAGQREHRDRDAAAVRPQRDGSADQAGRVTGCHPGSIRGSPKRASTLVSNRVSALIWWPARVATSRPLARATPAWGSRL